MNQLIKSMVAMLAVAGCCSSYAEVSADEAKQLGGALLPWGAEKAGNKEGTIPEYGGGLVMPPASYNPAKPGVLTDPFANEKPLYSITDKNMAQYADKLSEGQKAMLKKYPTFRIDVYPTHRTANYPKFVTDNTLVNATKCKLVGPKLEGCIGGIPFPIPKTGEQVAWNHQLAYQGTAWKGRLGSFVVDASGNVNVMSINQLWFDFPYYFPSNNGSNVPIYERTRYDYQEPARVAGGKILLHYKIDNGPTNVWQYLMGQRRVKLSPDLAYDTPHPLSAGSATMDGIYGFYGPTDRYDMRLVGKKEMFIPYNAFKLHSPECAATADKGLTKNHSNPSCMRWELHRVWVVEATLKPGKRHVYPKRVLYLDEDTYDAGVFDNYDMSGKLYRFAIQVGIPSYHEKSLGMSGLPFSTMDLQTGVYGFDNYPDFNTKCHAPIPYNLPDREWQPEALAGSGVR